jgi:TrpR-related protein YerC/YecD
MTATLAKPAASPPSAATKADDRVRLFDALLALKTREEVEAFLTDLCTPAEVRAFAERWAVARLLDQGGRSYREIACEAGASPTTVVRVARFLKEMPHQGYRLVLDRLHPKA